MSPIQSLAPSVPPLANISPPAAPGSGEASPFRNLLLEGLDQVNSMQQEANAAVEQLVTGGDVNPAEVLTTLQKADMSFKLMLQIRNKLVQAYQEVNNIRI
jgi:flagellar hook-basal body complex protein FliE